MVAAVVGSALWLASAVQLQPTLSARADAKAPTLVAQRHVSAATARPALLEVSHVVTETQVDARAELH
ncbi:MAG: hypothetical protein JO224_07060 [Pelomonas sp.]|nr:hypothetical protein [Roseateles sp.]